MVFKLKLEKNFDPQLEGLRLALQMMIAAYLAARGKNNQTPHAIAGEINAMLFQVDGIQNNILQWNPNTMSFEIKRSQLFTFINQLFATQKVVSTAA